MAALVSEYTLEFFTLNARGKKELIEWCMKEGLIASSYECPKCNEQMGLNERKSVVLDGFEWRCRKKVFVMFRRKPTRIDLKVEDLQEYETMKKEREQKDPVDDKEPTEPTEATSDNQKSKQANINERIGYKPQPRVSS
ncbi:uncharacterized protein TNCV_621921 [Trichonephila clavipes]|nr:uncharacterized protein TNCV_621921 [Trichonephila clavipes]